MNRFRRFSWAICAFFIVFSAPAHADSYSRERSGTSRWSPQTGQFTAYYFNQQSNDFVWKFDWNDVLHYTELNGRHRAIEFKARVNYLYADQYDGYYWSDFPSGSVPYRDTMQSDFSSGDERRFGYGAGNANYFLVSAPAYTADVGVYKVFLNNNSWEVTVDTRASTNESHDIPADCYGGDATFCVFPDYIQRLVQRGRFLVTQTQTRTVDWTHNYLYNQSFEQGVTAYSFGSGNNYAVYCDGSGFGSSCYLQYNRGSAGTAIVGQSVNLNTTPGDSFTVEAMIRCRTGTSCPVRLVYWGLGGSYPAENAVSYPSIPNDGRWHICRLDWSHGANVNFAYPHSILRWEVFNDSGGNMDVDFTHLGLYTERLAGTSGDQAPPPPVGPTCQPAGQFDT